MDYHEAGVDVLFRTSAQARRSGDVPSIVRPACDEVRRRLPWSRRCRERGGARHAAAPIMGKEVRVHCNPQAALAGGPGRHAPGPPGVREVGDGR